MSQVGIFLEYKLINSSQWHCVEMSPEDYFDLEPDEEIEWNCIPEYDRGIDYLNIDRGTGVSYFLTIVDIKLQDDPLIYEILRFERDEENLPKLCSHILIKEENGCEEEKQIYP
jgi:hypothetical protein